MEKSNKEKQLRPGLWQTVNERYPGSMITKNDFVPLAKLKKPLNETRLTFVSTAGVQTKDSLAVRHRASSRRLHFSARSF